MSNTPKPFAWGLVYLGVALTLAWPRPARGQAPPQPFEVGIQVADVFKLVEEQEEPAAYALAGRWSARPALAYRAGASYRQTTDETGRLQVGGRLGADHAFVREPRWRFYAGLDAVVLYERFRGGENTGLTLGVSPVLGFQARVARRLSLSSEPRLLLLYRSSSEEVFDERESDRWFEAALAGIGHLQVNVHF